MNNSLMVRKESVFQKFADRFSKVPEGIKNNPELYEFLKMTQGKQRRFFGQTFTTLSKKDIDKITDLDIRHSYVRSLDGLEDIKNLKSLTASLMLLENYDDFCERASKLESAHLVLDSGIIPQGDYSQTPSNVTITALSEKCVIHKGSIVTERKLPQVLDDEYREDIANEIGADLKNMTRQQRLEFEYRYRYGETQQVDDAKKFVGLKYKKSQGLELSQEEEQFLTDNKDSFGKIFEMEALDEFARGEKICEEMGIDYMNIPPENEREFQYRLNYQDETQREKAMRRYDLVEKARAGSISNEEMTELDGLTIDLKPSIETEEAIRKGEYITRSKRSPMDYSPEEIKKYVEDLAFSRLSTHIDAYHVSEICATDRLKQAIKEGSLTQEQYNELEKTANFGGKSLREIDQMGFKEQENGQEFRKNLSTQVNSKEEVEKKDVQREQREIEERNNPQPVKQQEQPQQEQNAPQFPEVPML